MRRSSSGSSRGRGEVRSLAEAPGLACLRRTGSALATVPPGDESAEYYVQASEAGGEKIVPQGGGTEGGQASDDHEADAHDRDDRNREGAAGGEAGTIKEEPRCGQSRLQSSAVEKEGKKYRGCERGQKSQGDLRTWPG